MVGGGESPPRNKVSVISLDSRQPVPDCKKSPTVLPIEARGMAGGALENGNGVTITSTSFPKKLTHFPYQAPDWYSAVAG